MNQPSRNLTPEEKAAARQALRILVRAARSNARPPQEEIDDALTQVANIEESLRNG